MKIWRRGQSSLKKDAGCRKSPAVCRRRTNIASAEKLGRACAIVARDGRAFAKRPADRFDAGDEPGVLLGEGLDHARCGE